MDEILEWLTEVESSLPGRTGLARTMSPSSLGLAPDRGAVRESPPVTLSGHCWPRLDRAASTGPERPHDPTNTAQGWWNRRRRTPRGASAEGAPRHGRSYPL